FSLAHLTAYSVHWLNAWDIPTNYENVSVLSARLFPTDFGMSGFPELPDALRTNRSLLQMRPKYRGFATSDPRKGVYLTEKGRTEVARVIEAIGVPTFEGKSVQLEDYAVDPRRPAKNRERTYSPTQILEDRRSRLLFRRFKEGQFADTDVVHLLGLLGLYDHTPPVEVRREFKQLRDLATAVHDDEFLQFLDAVNERFGTYLDRPDQSHRKEPKNGT
ncbi:MAG: hypothetical protein NT028_06240, partial [candidate division Zixibacteria bacterium]|nr:hypothetical protein [candidate division Zixibacteria bacterium]